MVALAIQLKIYLANSYFFMRDLSEKINGLLRQYFSKSFGFNRSNGENIKIDVKKIE